MENNTSWKKILRRNSQRQSLSQDDELVQLEAEFRNAYTLKALEAQLAEKEAARLAEEVQEKLSWQLITQEQEKVIAEEKIRSLEASRTRRAYKKVLEDQIASKVEAKRLEEATAREEQKVLAEVDELMDKVHELAKQNRRDYEAKRSRRERLLFEEIREIKRVLQEEKEAAMIEREQLYLEEVERRSCEVRKLRADQVKRREALIEQVARLFVDATLERREREAVIGDLVAEEMRHEAMIEEWEQEQWRKAKREELAADLMDQMLLSVECEARARERDRIFAEEVLAKVMMENTKLASLTAESRRRKQQQYKADLEKLIAERKRMREKILAQARVELNESRAMEEAKRQRIKVERRRLIEQHAGNVAAYLRDGVLSQEEENIVKELLDKCKQSLVH